MDPRAALLTAFLLLVGCVAPPAPSTSTDAGPAAARAHFGAPILVGVGAAIESSLRIRGDVMLACAHGAFVKPSPTWASVDGGSSWRKMATHPGTESGDCDVAVAEDGTWFAVFDTNDAPNGALNSADLDAGRETLAVSVDKGATWSTTPVPVATVPQSDRPWLMTMGNALVVVAGNYMLKYPGTTTAAVTRDRGATWSVAAVATGDQAFPNVVRGPLVLSPDGKTLRAPLAFTNVYVPTSVTRFALGVSRDGGASWSVERVADVEGAFAFPAAAQAGDGTLYWAYHKGPRSSTLPEDLTGTGTPNGPSDTLVLASKDDGRSWSKPLLVAEAQNFTGAPNVWIDGRPDGSATLVWSTNASAGDAPRSVVNAARIVASPQLRIVWSGPAIDPVPMINPNDWGPSVRHDASGRAAIAYPMAGDACADGPGGKQCVWLVRES